MCISNERAIRMARAFKIFYHKYGIGHIVLFISYLLFLLFSAGIFFIIESRNANHFRNKWLQARKEQRKRFIEQELIPQIFNNTRFLVFIHHDKTQYLKNLLQQNIVNYERQFSRIPPLTNSYLDSLLFVCSTVTTVGYSATYPLTRIGHYFSILCALLGIPFTLLVIKDLSYLTATIFRYPCICFVYLWHIFRYCTLQPVDENELIQNLHGEKATARNDYRLKLMDYLLRIPIMVVFLAMVGWATVGCFIVQVCLPEAETFQVFYFIFNSLATIGAGNVNAGENPMLLLLFFPYLLIGLSLVSLFINLLHTKLSRAYWLPSRMYLPLTTKSSSQNVPLYDVESFESFDNINYISDCPLNHYVTLGVLQSEDKCPLLGVIEKERAYVDANTQTQDGYLMRPVRAPSPEALLIKKPYTSQDDVNDLIVETYGTRPPRLITTSNER